MLSIIFHGGLVRNEALCGEKGAWTLNIAVLGWIYERSFLFVLMIHSLIIVAFFFLKKKFFLPDYSFAVGVSDSVQILNLLCDLFFTDSSVGNY